MKSPKMLAQRARRSVRVSSGSSARWLYVAGTGILVFGLMFDIVPTANAIQRDRQEHVQLVIQSQGLETAINTQPEFDRVARGAEQRLRKFASIESEDHLLRDIAAIRDRLRDQDHQIVDFVEASPQGAAARAVGTTPSSGQPATKEDAVYQGEATPTPAPTPPPGPPVQPGTRGVSAAARPRPGVSPTPDVRRLADQVAHQSFRMRRLTRKVHGTAQALLAFVSHLRDAGVLVEVGDPQFQNSTFDQQLAAAPLVAAASPTAASPPLDGQIDLVVYRIVLPSASTPPTPAVPVRVGLR